MNSYASLMLASKNISGLVVSGDIPERCPIKQNFELESRQVIPNVYKDVLNYFMEKMDGSYYEIVGTFGISNTLYFSDIDVNLYTVISSIELLYERLKSLGNTDDTGYIYSDLKIGSEHFDKEDLYDDRLIHAVKSLVNDPKVIKHDIIFYDGDIYREASFFLMFRNDSELAYLNLDRNIVSSIKESFMEEMYAGNFMKAIKRLLSLSKATGNTTFVNKLMYYIDSEYNQLSMIISGIDSLRLVKLYLDPYNEHIDDVIKELLYMYESTKLNGMPIVSEVSDILYSNSEDGYAMLITSMKDILNNDLANNMRCKGTDLMGIYNVM